MASRLSGGVYAAPGTYANTQTDINLDNQISNPRLAYLNSGGLGASNTASSQILPILPLNATPSVNGLTESGTTVTVTLGSPHGLTIGTSGQTITIAGAGVSGYNTSPTTTIVSVTGAYTFTYTAGSSGLANSGGGTCTLLGGTVAALLAFQPVLNGTSINGSTCGPLEIWSDGAIWDTTNSRYITPQLGGYDPANFRS